MYIRINALIFLANILCVHVHFASPTKCTQVRRDVRMQKKKKRKTRPKWPCHEKLFLTKWHPKAEKKLLKRRFFDTADRHEKLYGRSRLYASAQGRHETGGVLSLFSSLSFDISIKNSVQRWSPDFQGLFRVKIRKMAHGSNDLSTQWSLHRGGATHVLTVCSCQRNRLTSSPFFVNVKHFWG